MESVSWMVGLWYTDWPQFPSDEVSLKLPSAWEIGCTPPGTEEWCGGRGGG